MKKLMAVLITVVTFFTSVATEVFADGYPTGPYIPYQPHVPVPTGLEDTSLFYILASVAFVLGMSVLTSVKVLKNKQVLK